MTSRGLRRTAFTLLAASLFGGCGKDYEPPELETTGRAAPRVGQIVDVEIAFPGLQLPFAVMPGVFMDLELEIEGVGLGEHMARATFGPGVEDLSNGQVQVVITPDAWITGMLGPLRIQDSLLEVLLRGETDDAGWVVSGQAFETLTANEGSFEGFRRHRFLVAGTDFFSEVGRVAEVELVWGREIRVRTRLELISSDAVLRARDGAVFVVNRFTFDNLQRLDPLADFATAWQAPVGSGSNPHDVLMLDDGRSYVTRYEPPFDDVGVFDPQTREIVSSISLQELSQNPDGTPRADRMARAAGAVFVALQDIDRSFTQFGEGKLAVVDPTLDAVVGVVPLGGKNPGAIEVLRGADGVERLYVALAGIFPGLQAQELSGGVIVVNAFDRVVERIALDDDDAGGNISGLTMVSDSLGYVIVSDDSFVNSVLAFDPRTGDVLRTVHSTTDLIAEIETSGAGVLAVPDRSFHAPGLCLYRTPLGDDATETLIGCGALELPPFSIEALD